MEAGGIAGLSDRTPRRHCHGNQFWPPKGDETDDMKLPPDPYFPHGFPAGIINHADRLYHVFGLSLRDVDLAAKPVRSANAFIWRISWMTSQTPMIRAYDSPRQKPHGHPPLKEIGPESEVRGGAEAVPDDGDEQ
jgi:hypothetical protein